MRRTTGMKALVMLVAVALLGLAVACGGDDGSSEPTPTSPSGAAGTPGAPGPAGVGAPGPDSPTVEIDSLAMGVGAQGDVDLVVREFPAPGLGAWTVDITYDTDVISIIACEPQPETSVCNPEYRDNVVRVVGATAEGLDGDTNIGLITVQCDAAGSSDLALSIETLADGTIGDPQLIAAHVSNGTVTCNE